MLATFSVLNVQDSGANSLRWAIEQANITPEPDVINFSTTGTITLGGTELPRIVNDLQILGPAGGITIDANHQSRVFQVAAGATAHLDRLTLTNGDAGLRTSSNQDPRLGKGGLIYNEGSLVVTRGALTNSVARDGGAIMTSGPLVVDRCTITGNRVLAGGTGASYWWMGAGIFVQNTTASITASTISNNHNENGNGGGIALMRGSLDVSNSLISGNSSWHTGSGILNDTDSQGNKGVATITNSTISGNAKTGIQNYGTMTVTHCTVTGNGAYGILNGLQWVTGTLYLNNTLSLYNGADDLNWSEGSTNEVHGSYYGAVNPPGLLGPLQDNGGPTLTHAVLAATPANLGDPAYTTPTDQRGGPRPSSIDPGAFQRNAANPVNFETIVTTLNDEDNGTSDPASGAGTSLREAINTANLLGGRNTIVFNVGGTSTLGGTQLPVITDTAGLEIMTVGAPVTISGNNASRIFDVAAGAALDLSRLTLTGGNSGVAAGGAIRSSGALTISDSVISNSVSGADGGGIYASGSIAMYRSSVTGNSAVRHGGGVYTEHASFTIDGSTFSGNTAGADGGGALFRNNPVASTIVNSTFSGNSANYAGGLIFMTGTSVTVNHATIVNNSGGGIRSHSDPIPQIRNSIVANNIDGDYNGSLDGSNLTGVVALGPLANNGGPVPTHALPAGSPAIDAANPATAPAADQRGVPRNGPGIDAGPAADIGAYERINAFVVTTRSDDNDGLLHNATSLRDAIHFANANPGHDTIRFNVSPGTVTLAYGLLPTITGELNIVGPGADRLTISGNNTSRILDVANGAEVTLSRLRIADSHAIQFGAVRNSGTLTVANSIFVDNVNTFSGSAALSNSGSGTLTVIGSTFLNNVSRAGAAIGIPANSVLTVINSTFSGNIATELGGGAIRNFNGTVTILNSTLTDNRSDGTGNETGGGIWSNHVLGGSTTVINSIVANNIGGDMVGPFTGSHNLFGTLELEPLDHEIGVTPTHALPPGSPAIDAGDPFFNPADVGVVFDQRGEPFNRVVRATDGPTNDWVGLAEIRFGDSSGGIITPTAAFASTYYSNAQRPQNLINGSGLNTSGGDVMTWTHAPHNNAVGMWHAGAGQGIAGAAPFVAKQYVVLDLGDNYDLSNAYLWQMVQPNLLTRGLKHFRLLGSPNAPDSVHAANPPAVYDLTGFTEILGVNQLSANPQGGPTPTQAFDLAGATNVRQIYLEIIDNYHTGPRVDIGAVEFEHITPAVQDSEFLYLTAPHSLRFMFSHDVSASLDAGDLLLENLTTSQTVSAGDLSVSYNPATNIATFSYVGILPDGNYRATLLAAGITGPGDAPLAADHQSDFFVLAGDANRDRKVDVADLGILASNWQQSPRLFSQADFNYDGVVDVADLGILASSWQKELAAPSASFARETQARRPTRLIDQIQML